MPVVALKGMQALDEVELRALIATLLRLENISVFLGAGASVPLGGKTMAGVWADFVDKYPEHAKWLANNKFITNAAVDEAAQHCPNVEELADALEVARSEWRRAKNANLKQLDDAAGSLLRALVRGAMCKDDWWTDTSGEAGAAPELKHHRSLLQKLVGARQPGQSAPWVFTTNYDLAIEWAAESVELQVLNGFIGLHTRRFLPHSFDLGFRNVQARGEARFGAYNIYLAKLHGSLNWQQGAGGDVREIQALAAFSELTNFLSDPAKTDIGFLVLPRAAKYLQTTGYVMGELFRRFSDFLGKPQAAMLVTGYGFGDEHINRMMLSALLNPTLQLVIFYPAYQGKGNDIDPNLPPTLRKLLSLGNPRVTIVGGGAEAYFDRVAAYLPDPVLYDEEMRRLREALQGDKADGAGGATA